MRIQLIPPTRADVAELLYVERHSLGDSDYAVDEALAVLATPAQRCFGCYVDATLVGFLSCIETWSALGARLELDMLGVLPDHRGRGYAGALVAEAIRYGQEQRFASARAIVAVDNAASQATFRREGFSPVATCAMLIWNRPHSDAAAMGARLLRQQVRLPGRPHAAATLLCVCDQQQTTASATAIEVTTLAYRGCWIEDISGPSPEDRLALVTHIGCEAVAAHLDEAGMLVPRASVDGIAALTRLGWQRVGDYDILARTIGPAR